MNPTFTKKLNAIVTTADFQDGQIRSTFTKSNELEEKLNNVKSKSTKVQKLFAVSFTSTKKLQVYLPLLVLDFGLVFISSNFI